MLYLKSIFIFTLCSFILLYLAKIKVLFRDVTWERVSYLFFYYGVLRNKSPLNTSGLCEICLGNTAKSAVIAAMQLPYLYLFRSIHIEIWRKNKYEARTVASNFTGVKNWRPHCPALQLASLTCWTSLVVNMWKDQLAVTNQIKVYTKY